MNVFSSKRSPVSKSRARKAKSSRNPLSKIQDADAGLGLENLTPADTYWGGDDDRFDETEILRTHVYDQYNALELLLLSIISKHPSTDTATERLKIAMHALTGEPFKNGRPLSEDDEVLRAAAWRYHQLTFYGQKIELAPLFRKCLAMVGDAKVGSLERNEEAENPRIKRLIRKFNREKDVLLTQVTHEQDPDRLVLLSKIAADLKKLGVKLDVNIRTIRPPRGT